MPARVNVKLVYLHLYRSTFQPDRGLQLVKVHREIREGHWKSADRETHDTADSLGRLFLSYENAQVRVGYLCQTSLPSAQPWSAIG